MVDAKGVRNETNFSIDTAGPKILSFQYPPQSKIQIFNEEAEG
jgi:hypothetical protein